MASQSSSRALVVPASGEPLVLAETFEDQINLLAAPTPQQYIKQRKGRGKKIFDYVEFSYVIARLNATFRYDWDVDVVEQNVYKEVRQIATKVRLTVRFADGRAVSKTAWGGSDIKQNDSGKVIDVADDLKSSESDAIKKAASMLGLCWDVYSGVTNGNSTPTEEEEEVVNGEEVIESEKEPREGQDIADMASNPDKDSVEKKVIAKWIKEYLEKSTIDYKAFKTYLHVTEFKPPRQFTGKQFGNVSLSEGNIEDLRYLQKNIDKCINLYINSKKDEQEESSE